MAGWKQWLSGEVVEHTDFQTYLQDQVVQNYAGTAARSSALGTAVSEGMVSYLEDTNALELYTTSWIPVVTTATTAVVSNTMLVNPGITLNGSAVALGGSLTIPGTGFTNPMTNLGDLIVGGTAGVADRLGIGTNGQYLFTNGTVASWAAIGTATTISGNIAPTQITAGTFNAGNFTFGSALTVTGAFTANPAAPSDANAAKAAGYVGMPQVALSSGGTTISAIHAGDHIYNTSAGTVTIPANSSVPLEIGTTVVIINGNNTSAVNITTDTLRQAGTSNTGQRTIAAYGMATLVKVASTTWYISGNGVS